MRKFYNKLLLGFLFTLSLLGTRAQNVNVNPGAGTYPTLQTAFAAINAGTHTGAITVDIIANTTETGTAVLNASGSGAASYTSILVQPSGGSMSVTGALALPLVDLNGADNVTINGLNAGGNSLTFSNTNAGTTAGTSTIRFIADATNNTVTNCSILGSTTSTLATAAGTVLFSTGTTTGNDNNILSNNNIGPAGANLPSKAIMASGTSSAIENDNVQVTGNNIFDFFLAGGSLSGINIVTGNEGWTISNNRFYQTGTRTFTAAALRYSAITLNNSTGSFTVSGNTIGFASAAGTGVTTIAGSSNEFRGIDAASVNTSTATLISNNTITAINQSTSRASTTTSSSCFIAVAMGTTDGLINATGNTIGSIDGSTTIVVNQSSITASSAPVVGFYNFSFFSTSISSNNIGYITIQGTGTTTGFRGILVNTTTGTSATVNNNTITNITDLQVGSYAIYGIQTALPNLTATGNTMRNFSGSSNGSALIIAAGLVTSGSTGANTISQNTIHSLSNASGAVANSIYGMSLSLPATANIVERNNIHSFSLTSTLTGTQIWGISAGATGTAVYRNNMIRLGIDAAGAPVTLPTSIVGIREFAGATNQFYHNSIYIGGSGVLATPAASNSYCFFSEVVTVTRNFQDNIFYNARSNAAGGGVAHIAIRVGGTAANPAGLTSNYNDLYVTGTDGVIGFFNAAVYTTIAAWRTATGQDINSFNADPQFLTPAGTAATVNLHINPAVVTPVEGGGLAIASVTDDFDGQVRSTLTPTDIGADAGNFTGLPPMSYVSSTTTQTVVTNVSINSSNQQVIGIQVVTTGTITPLNVTSFSLNTNGTTNVADITNAKIFYTGTSATFATTMQFGTTVPAPAGSYNVTGTQVLAEGTNYFWLTYDIPCVATVGNIVDAECTSITVGGVPQTPTVTDPGTGRTIFNGLLSGTYTVGTGGNYATLTAAVAAVNSAGLGGNTTLSILNSLTEAGAVVINQWTECGAGGYTLTISPAAGTTPTISASSTTSVIKLNGADRVIIDGSNNGTASRDMTITNTLSATSTAAVWVGSALPDGAHNNVVKNCNISANADQSTGTLFSFGIISSSSAAILTGATDNDDNLYENNLVTKASVGIISIGGVPANPNQNTIIRNNNVGPAAFGANEIGTAGILLFNENNPRIQNNDIGFIGDLATSGGGSGRDRVGIVLGSTGAAWSTLGAGTAVLVTNAIVSNNRIHDIVERGTFSAAGITLNGVDGTNNTNNLVANNMIYNIQSNGTSGDHTAGIGIASGRGDRVVYNSIYLTGDTDPGAATSSGTSSAGISIPVTAPVNLSVRNNIVVMDLSSNTTTVLNAAISTASGFSWGTGGSNFNDYVAPATNTQSRVGNFGGTFQATLANWQTASSQDANSISLLPVFVSATDLHLTAANCGIDGRGVPVAGVTTDIDNNTRDAGAPDMGADEFTATPGTTLAVPAGPGTASTTYNVSPPGTTYSTTACELIARVLPSGATPVAGLIRAAVTVDASVQVYLTRPYVQRHYDIEPATGAATATATVTLYFTDQEFIDYSANNTGYYDLPTVAGGGSADPLVARLRVIQYHGTGTAPGNYTGATEVIDPADADIIYNAGLLRWEVTIPVNGFSGFYISSDPVVTPINISYFRGARQNGVHNLDWKVNVTSSPSVTLTLERSADSRSFSPIYNTTATDTRTLQPFAHTDNQPLPGINYYRLKMTDVNGKVYYSGIVALVNGTKGFDLIGIAPNPVVNGSFKLNITSATALRMDLQVSDMQGKIVMTQTANVSAGSGSVTVTVDRLAAGTYNIYGITPEGKTRLIRFVKN